MPDANLLIDLAAPRSIVFQDRGHAYTYTLAPIAAAQWKRYFDGVVSTAETVDKNVVNQYDNSTASAELVRSAVTAVAGYRWPEGVDAGSVDAWKPLLPLAHLLTVAANLRGVERVDAGEPVTLGSESVTLAALWGLSFDGMAMMRRVGLIHRFKAPTIEHQRRYDRDRNRSVILGGSRTGKTRWLGAQNTLTGIYDELIVSVEGYRVGGDAPDVDTIRSRMDAYHKVAAAEGLFAPAMVDEAVDEAEDGVA